jgi:hypothetical protein
MNDIVRAGMRADERILNQDNGDTEFPMAKKTTPVSPPKNRQDARPGAAISWCFKTAFIIADPQRATVRFQCRFAPHTSSN